MKMRTYTAALAAMLTLCAVAAPVTEDTARTAANAFVTTDAIGSAILGGRTVGNIQRRGELWIVALEPAGHIILSASDLAKPIIGFSEDNFTEPDPDSPAFALLEGNSERIRRLEESATDSSTPDPQWASLLNPTPRSKKLLGDPAVADPGTIRVAPFLKTHFNQCQPFNDFAPVYDSSDYPADDKPYRGRCPCGCVATASATALNYFRWPARIDNSAFYAGRNVYDNEEKKWCYQECNFIDTNNVLKSFPIRFDGHNPIAWNAISNNYVRLYTNDQGKIEYDLRGNVAESTRFPIARLILWMDVLAEMLFESDNSSAYSENIPKKLSDWYTTGTWITNSFEHVLPNLQCGIPCQATIDGHQVVVHGWAERGTDKYAYFDFGWGGSNDGYYNIYKKIDGGDDSTYEFMLQRILIDHYPRAKPQLDPLPNVCSTNLTLSWHFPDLYTNNLSGFIINSQKFQDHPSDFLDDFSSSTGIAEGEMFVTNVVYDYFGQILFNGDDILFAKTHSDSSYTFPEKFIVTSASVLTFRLRSYLALGTELEIQARFNDGDWEPEPIATPSLAYHDDSGWETIRIYLGDHGGRNAQFRIKTKLQGGSLYSQGSIMVDDFKLTQILKLDELTPRNVATTERTCALNGLSDGATYTFTVSPRISSPLVDGETSDPLTVSIAGTRKTPLPGKQTDTPQTLLTFSTNDTSGVWSYSGTAVDDTTILDKSNCSISVNIWGSLTTSSSLSFGWSANNFYEDGPDTLTAMFVAADGSETNVWTKTNQANSNRENVSVSLGSLAGKSGRLTISCKHSGRYFVGDQYGGRLYEPKITNVLVPEVPAVKLKTETLTALGEPEIISVDDVDEGFFKECNVAKAAGSAAATENNTDPTHSLTDSEAADTSMSDVATTTFIVTCSENVRDLRAYPSHLALVRDEDIRVERIGTNTGTSTQTPTGSGSSTVPPGTSTGGHSTGPVASGPVQFKVCITPRGVNETNYRSRMILTLEAVDANGTKTYKDLSLRFEKVEPTEEPTTTIDIPDSDNLSIDITYSWFEGSGLTNISEIAATELSSVLSSLAQEDSDGDGISNWQEYVCGTSPTNDTDKIICTISFNADGSVNVGTSLDENKIASGFEAKIKAKRTLDNTSSWVDKSENPSGPFFKVVIEPISESSSGSED